jgi:hypothetical protein
MHAVSARIAWGGHVLPALTLRNESTSFRHFLAVLWLFSIGLIVCRETLYLFGLGCPDKTDTVGGELWFG